MSLLPFVILGNGELTVLRAEGPCFSECLEFCWD